MSDDEHRDGVPLVEDLLDRDSPAPTKRKRANEKTTEAKKSAKRRRLKKPRDVDDEALDAELGVNHAVAHMDPSLLADHIAQRTQRFRPDLSLVELEDCYVPGKAIVDTTSWGKARTSEQLAEFLEQFAGPRRKKKGKRLGNASEEMGSPHTIVVAGAGLRAADLTRALRKFQTKEALVAKLFAKHIKLKDAIEMVSKSRMNIGVGTPQRLIDLLDDGALATSHLERILIDASHIDQKKRGILDMKETQMPLVQLLARKDLKGRYDSSEKRVELLFF